MPTTTTTRAAGAPVATTSEAGRVVASNAHAMRQQQAAADREQARAELAVNRADTTPPLFPETVGAVPLATLPDVRFSRADARRPIERPREPLLQWATGLQTKDRQLYAGWLVEAGKHEDLDLAMNDAGFSQVTIKHGAGNMVNHWALPVASLFVVCDGVQTISEMRETQERYGIAFGWRNHEGRQQSVLRARVFVQELCAVGYVQPLLLSLKSTLTGDMLKCMARHYTVLDSINPIRKASGKPPIAVPFYAVALVLGAGVDVARGSGGQTREIAPMVEHEERDREYVLAHWCKREWASVIEGLCDETVLWSKAQSVRIAAGDAPEGEE